MLLPLVVLGLLSFVGGWVGVPAAMHGHNEFEHFLDPVFQSAGTLENISLPGHESHGLELGLAAVSVLTAGVGFFFAWLFYYKKPGTAGVLAKRFAPVYELVENKFYVDEIYQGLFVTGLLGFTRIFLYGLGDRIGVDGVGKFAGWIAMDFGEAARRMQSGNLRSYAGWLALGAAVVMAVMIFGFGHAAFLR
jgi:NADH-quinone oxidoreductase subunit L